MAQTSVNFANITNIIFNSTQYDEIKLNGVSRWKRVWVQSSTTQQVDRGYWTYPNPYQEYVETSRTYGSTFRWSAGCADATLGMWPDGSPSGNYVWLTYSCPYWTGRTYTTTGYYRWVYPPAYYTSNWVTETVDTSHWEYFY